MVKFTDALQKEARNLIKIKGLNITVREKCDICSSIDTDTARNWLAFGAPLLCEDCARKIGRAW